MPSDFAVHSDILVHWTGKDIDNKNLSGEAIGEEYLTRLHNILHYGFWMTEQEFEGPDGALHKVPPVPCLCFTELKLSQSREHAKRYGRLGIGVKRPFLLDRGGRPVVYRGYSQQSTKDSLFMDCLANLKDKRWMHFFKPMNLSSSSPMDYHFYSESEWRIVYHDALHQNGHVIDPTSSEASQYTEALSQDDRRKLKHLVPLDVWLAVIIYPNLKIKRLVQRSSEIRKRLEHIKKSDRVKNDEVGCPPAELDLDLCMNL